MLKKENTKIKNLPKTERPREKLVERGAENLKDEELLAILLGTGTKGKNVIETAKGILKKYSKKNLFKLTYKDLSNIKGIGSAKACIILSSFELVKRIIKFNDNGLPKVSSVKDVLLQVSYLKTKNREHLMAIYLNARNELLFRKHIFLGTLNSSLVHPREIFNEALKQNAVSIILVHNHPSGDSNPSEDDLQITKRLQEAGKIMGIEILDHIIIGNNNHFSFRENKII